MSAPASRRLFLTAAGLILATLPIITLQPVQGEEKEKAKPQVDGILWCIGSVQYSGDGQPRIDLGDAHGLTEGSEVAVFRSQDTYFRPLGILRIQESFATWAIPEPGSIDLQDGDRVIYVRTITQMGTGESFREGYLRQQLVKIGNHNAYSTVMKQGEADALQRYVARHPRWARDQKHIAGTIRSESVSRKDVEEMQPLLSQIVLFQSYQALGIAFDKTIGLEWHNSLRVLTPTADFVFDAPPRITQSSPANTSETPADVNSPPENTAEVTAAKMDLVKREVERILFVRDKEEQRVVMILCLALEKMPSRNERQWFSLQTQSTQFSSLAADEQFLDDLQLVMKRTREQE